MTYCYKLNILYQKKEFTTMWDFIEPLEKTANLELLVDEKEILKSPLIIPIDIELFQDPEQIEKAD